MITGSLTKGALPGARQAKGNARTRFRRSLVSRFTSRHSIGRSVVQPRRHDLTARARRAFCQIPKRQIAGFSMDGHAGRPILFSSCEPWPGRWRVRRLDKVFPQLVHVSCDPFRLNLCASTSLSPTPAGWPTFAGFAKVGTKRDGQTMTCRRTS